jgi:hypothetical protein
LTWAFVLLSKRSMVSGTDVDAPWGGWLKNILWH